jgi:hypothetical protein
MAERVRLEPRGLSKESAARYCGLSASAFADWRRRGLLPGPIPGTHRWDRLAIDDALDRLSRRGAKSQPSAYEEWKAMQDADER